MTKPGRNDLCPCGSGKKYKKCCMLKVKANEIDEQSNIADNSSENKVERMVDHHVARTSEIENNFRRACRYMESNEFDKAVRIFRSVIMLDHSHYKALTGLGKCLAEMGKYEEASKCFEKALEINPEYVQANINLAFYKTDSRMSS